MTASAILDGHHVEQSVSPRTPIKRLVDRVAGLHRRAVERRVIEVSIRRLQTFDDHLLRDLGLHRDDIENRVRG